MYGFKERGSLLIIQRGVIQIIWTRLRNPNNNTETVQVQQPVLSVDQQILPYQPLLQTNFVQTQPTSATTLYPAPVYQPFGNMYTPRFAAK
jgi:hypothetical protein